MRERKRERERESRRRRNWQRKYKEDGLDLIFVSIDEYPKSLC